jgi:hypothetical protein
MQLNVTDTLAFMMSSGLDQILKMALACFIISKFKYHARDIKFQPWLKN